MARMAVMTKSFAPDFELCAALNRSVLDNTPDAIHHHIIVPRSDLKLFDRLAGPRGLRAWLSTPRSSRRLGHLGRLGHPTGVFWPAYYPRRVVGEPRSSGRGAFLPL
jgi:hypothetical protein